MSERYAAACAGKKHYASPRKAEAMAKTSQIVFGVPMRAYVCPFCHLWHVGSIYPQYSTRARQERGEDE
jgi:hypothetical protein